jgi:hypothetical protein
MAYCTCPIPSLTPVPFPVPMGAVRTCRLCGLIHHAPLHVGEFSMPPVTPMRDPVDPYLTVEETHQILRRISEAHMPSPVRLPGDAQGGEA